VHDDTNLEEDPKAIAKREKVEATWKDIDDARQCGKPRDEIIATDRRGIDKIAAPKLNGHIRKLEAYLHTITEHPAHEFIQTRDDNITAEYEETDARNVQDPAQQKKNFRDIDISQVKYYNKTAKTELHLADTKTNAKMKVRGRPIFTREGWDNNKMTDKRTPRRSYLRLPNYKYRSTKEHIRKYNKLNLTIEEYERQCTSEHKRTTLDTESKRTVTYSVMTVEQLLQQKNTISKCLAAYAPSNTQWGAGEKKTSNENKSRSEKNGQGPKKKG
jgi:hypothetical protein